MRIYKHAARLGAGARAHAGWMGSEGWRTPGGIIVPPGVLDISGDSVAYPIASRAAVNTASNIGSVSRPVKVFCWLG